jgi:cell division protein FtsB
MQFDLRPVELLQKEIKKKSFSLMRLLVTLLFLFFVGSSGFYLATMTLKAIGLKEEIEYKQLEVDDLETSQRSLEAEIRRLQGREKVFSETLKIMQDDLPTIEAFNALESNTEYGMRLESVKFAAGQAGGANTLTVDASAATEDQIVQFTDGLTESGVFSQVRMPSSRLDEGTGRVAFTLVLSLLNIGQIGVVQ